MGAGGRPSAMDRVVADYQGRLVTVEQRILAAVRQGCYLEEAVALAGIHKDTAYGWLKLAAAAKYRAAGHPVDETDLTDHERRCIDFSDALERARGEYITETLLTIERIGRGGQVQKRTTTKRDGNGEVLETVTVEQELAPNWAALAWRLEKAFPARYGVRVDIAGLSGEELTDDERARALGDALRAHHRDELAEKRARKATRKKGARNGETAAQAGEGEG